MGCKQHRSTARLYEGVLSGSLRCLWRNGGRDDEARKTVPCSLRTSSGLAPILSLLLDPSMFHELCLVWSKLIYILHDYVTQLKRQVQAYLLEAKWLKQEYIPRMEEYMSNALVSSAYSMLTTTSFLGMGDIVTKEAFDWVFSDPKMIRASNVIGRLMDDIVSHEVHIYILDNGRCYCVVLFMYICINCFGFLFV